MNNLEAALAYAEKFNFSVIRSGQIKSLTSSGQSTKSATPTRTKSSNGLQSGLRQ